MFLEILIFTKFSSFSVFLTEGSHLAFRVSWLTAGGVFDFLRALHLPPDVSSLAVALGGKIGRNQEESCYPVAQFRRQSDFLLEATAFILLELRRQIRNAAQFVKRCCTDAPFLNIATLSSFVKVFFSFSSMKYVRNVDSIQRKYCM